VVVDLAQCPRSCAASAIPQPIIIQSATFTSIAIPIARLRVVFDDLNTPHQEQEFRVVRCTPCVHGRYDKKPPLGLRSATRVTKQRSQTKMIPTD
jgi:hypothetical protein